MSTINPQWSKIIGCIEASDSTYGTKERLTLSVEAFRLYSVAQNCEDAYWWFACHAMTIRVVSPLLLYTLWQQNFMRKEDLEIPRIVVNDILQSSLFRKAGYRYYIADSSLSNYFEQELKQIDPNRRDQLLEFANGFLKVPLGKEMSTSFQMYLQTRIDHYYLFKVIEAIEQGETEGQWGRYADISKNLEKFKAKGDKADLELKDKKTFKSIPIDDELWKRIMELPKEEAPKPIVSDPPPTEKPVSTHTKIHIFGPISKIKDKIPVPTSPQFKGDDFFLPLQRQSDDNKDLPHYHHYWIIDLDKQHVLLDSFFITPKGNYCIYVDDKTSQTKLSEYISRIINRGEGEVKIILWTPGTKPSWINQITTYGVPLDKVSELPEFSYSYHYLTNTQSALIKEQNSSAFIPVESDPILTSQIKELSKIGLCFNSVFNQLAPGKREVKTANFIAIGAKALSYLSRLNIELHNDKKSLDENSQLPDAPKQDSNYYSKWLQNAGICSSWKIPFNHMRGAEKFIERDVPKPSIRNKYNYYFDKIHLHYMCIYLLNEQWQIKESNSTRILLSKNGNEILLYQNQRRERFETVMWYNDKQTEKHKRYLGNILKVLENYLGKRFSTPLRTIDLGAHSDPRMVEVKGKEFKIGAASSVANPDSDELGQQWRNIPDFKMSRYEITVAAYEEYNTHQQADTNLPEEMYLPKVEISWKNAIDYCNWLSVKWDKTKCYSIDEKSGQVTFDPLADGFRLPTEAEWEYAAKGGFEEEGYLYAGGQLNDVAAYGHKSPQKVGSRRPNRLGIYDLTGNVWEFCWDWYESKYSPKKPEGEVEIGPKSGKTRVIRGGSFRESPQNLRITKRAFIPLTESRPDIGFRLARNIILGDVEAWGRVDKNNVRQLFEFVKRYSNSKYLDTAIQELNQQEESFWNDNKSSLLKIGDYRRIYDSSSTISLNRAKVKEARLQVKQLIKDFMPKMVKIPVNQPNSMHKHQSLKAFELADFPVTANLFTRYMQENYKDQSKFPNSTPAINITFVEALRFCNWLSIIYDLTPVYDLEQETIITVNWNANGYRLPSENEWEYVAKGADQPTSNRFPGSDNLSEVGVNGTEAPQAMNKKLRKPVSNTLPIYDLAGNVWEWCMSERNDPEKDKTINLYRYPTRPIRGGSFQSSVENCEIGARKEFLFNAESEDIGLRIARTL